VQAELAHQVILEDQLPTPISTVLGLDAAYQDRGNLAFAGGALIDVSSGELMQLVSATVEVDFPYVPGLLSFREVPALESALEKLAERPDLVITDGQGIAHPRRFGLACHIGVLYDVPAIGCAKTRLIGQGAMPALPRGSVTTLMAGGEAVGAILRTQYGVKPVYVSPGHRISLETACKWALELSPLHRIPEPIRIAHQAVGEMKRQTR
jgi:deoxyribonuclease V